EADWLVAEFARIRRLTSDPNSGEFGYDLTSLHANRVVVTGLAAGAPLDVAADAVNLLFRRRLAGEQRIHRGPQVAAGDGDVVPRPAAVELAAVIELALLIEQEKVGRAGRAVGLGDLLRL